MQYIDEMESLSMSAAAEYYRESFSHDLARWFTIERCRSSWNGCNFVPYMDGHFNPHRPVGRATHLFAAIVFLTILSQQLVWKHLGKEAAFALCKGNGWPIFSAGMGGFLHPIQMVSEAALLPEPSLMLLRALYCDCLDRAVPVFTALLPAEVLTSFTEEVSKFKDWICANEQPPFPGPLVNMW